MNTPQAWITEARKTAKLYRGVGHNYGIERTLDGLADALEAALKPRVMTTTEELDTLPIQSVVRDAESDLAELQVDFSGNRIWLFAGDMNTGHTPTLPVTVLFTP